MKQTVNLATREKKHAVFSAHLIISQERSNRGRLGKKQKIILLNKKIAKISLFVSKIKFSSELSYTSSVNYSYELYTTWF